MAAEVEELTGVKPQYVVTTGFAGLRGARGHVGELRVTSDFAIEDPEYDLEVT